MLAAAALAVGVGFLPLRVFGGGGVERARELERQVEDLRRRIAGQRAKNALMRREAQALRGDLRMIERVVRDELGLVRPGEIVFQFE